MCVEARKVGRCNVQDCSCNFVPNERLKLTASHKPGESFNRKSVYGLSDFLELVWN